MKFVHRLFIMYAIVDLFLNSIIFFQNVFSNKYVAYSDLGAYALIAFIIFLFAAAWQVKNEEK